MNKEIINILQGIGLSKEEIEIYLAGLELGEDSVQNIAKKAGIKRSTAYLIIDELIKKSLFYQTFKGKKRYFGAQDPKNIENDFKRKTFELSKIIPELSSLYNTSGIKPRVRFYEGLSGLITVYNDTVESNQENGEILEFASIKKIFDIFPREYATEYYTKRIRKNIKAKIIAVDSEESREWQKNSEEEMREIILVNEGQFDFFGDIQIYGDKVALISYKENFMTVVVESKEISKMFKSIFNLNWNLLKK